MTAAALDANFAALALAARQLGAPADAGQLAHRFGRGGAHANADEVLRAAQSLGLKARLVASRCDRLAKIALPALAELRDGRYVVVERAGPHGVVIHDPADAAPRLASEAEFAAAWSCRLILLAARRQAPEPPGKFGVSWFIPALGKYWRLFGEVLFASLFLQLLALVTPLFFQVVIDKVLVHRSLTTLDVLMIALVVAKVFETLLAGLRAYLSAHTTNRVDVELSAKLFRHLLSLPMGYFGARQVGDTAARVRELEAIRAFLTGSALTTVLDIFFGAGVLAVMWMYSPALTLIELATVPLAAALLWLSAPVFRRRHGETVQRGAENQAFLVETLTGIETLKAMAVEPQMQRRWEQQIAGYVRAAFRASNLDTWFNQAVALINNLALAACLWLGAREVMDGKLTVGGLVAFSMLLGHAAAPLLRLAQTWQQFQQVRVSIARLADIFDTPAEPAPGPSHGAPPVITGHVTFEDVTFRYRSDLPPALRDFTLDLPAGQVLGVVGPSGSGKSTFAKLAQRLHLPESGQVLVDGVDLALADPVWLRRQIGVVLQENILFAVSVAQNIALADPGAAMDRVVRAAQLAGAHDFILRLPQGYDTIVGERGSSLSGGQRQRIAIARALLTEPRILILDEATSALDYESERAIQDNMRAISQGRTVILITHRLGAIRQADRIITIENGAVTEDGTHEELVRRGGRYAGLYRHQLGLSVVASVE
jgi:subfamily B ATP-binding cassette protein HlyB/CyaB